MFRITSLLQFNTLEMVQHLGSCWDMLRAHLVVIRPVISHTQNMNFVLPMGCSSQLIIVSPTTHIVEDARFVSSCFSCPSSARPLLSLLLANSGRTVYTFESVNPGPTGQPALQPMLTLYTTCYITPQTHHQNCCQFSNLNC